jgi:hypothetical protein
MPTMLGINTVLIAIRLYFMNRSHIASERRRRERVAEALAGDDRGVKRGATPGPSGQTSSRVGASG